MAEKGNPKVLRWVALYLRLRTGLEQTPFGKACRVDQADISRYETGKRAPSEEVLKRMAAVSGVPWYAVVNMIRLYTAVVAAAERDPQPKSEAGAPPVEPPNFDPLDMAVAAYLVEEEAAEEGPSPEEKRREAAEICAALLPFPAADRRRLLGLSLRAAQSWAVAEALAHASERAAADDVEEAEELVQLALTVARQVPGEAERARTEGYCIGFWANVRRVATEFDEAREALARTWELWRAGEPAAALPLAEWRLLDIEASLLREQHRFPQALERLGEALALCSGEPAAAARILLKKEMALYQLGDYAAALATLTEAAPFVEAARDPHLLFALRFNTVTDLCSLERFAEAAPLLPAVREMALEQGKKLDRIRVAWLTTKVNAGLGRVEEAMAGLEQVRQDFKANDLPYEAAHSSLDLAVLYLKDGRTAEVRELAVAMGWIFTAKGIKREALAALTLFCEAAQQEAATDELVKRVSAEVERVQRSE